METKLCTMCKTPLGIRNKTGRCRPCNSKLFSRTNRDYMYKKNKEWRDLNPKKCKEYNDNNYAKHGDKQIARKKFRYQTDPIYRIRHTLRNRLNCAIDRQWKSGSAIENLGCSIEKLKKYLESKFQPGMTWDNHGKWHIDHIIPLSKFDLTDLVQLKKACHFNNLQPLWAEDNIKKGDK
jgi:hypothetical protein